MQSLYIKATEVPQTDII